MRVNQTKRRNMAELCPEWYIQRWDQMGNIFVRTDVVNSRLRVWQTMNINTSYRCWPIVWVRKGQAELLWLLPTYKILEWNFWLPQQPAMKIIRVELCTMLVAASSMLFSLRCGKLEPVPTSAAQYSILATIHTFLLIHSSMCWPWIDDDDYGYAGCENFYPTRIGAAAQVLISFLFYQGSHFSGLTKFPDFSSIFCHFSSIVLMFCFFNWKFNPFYQKNAQFI